MTSANRTELNAGERAWRHALANVPPWSPPSKRTVVVVPHPDDEVLGMGGLIAHQRRRRVDVDVVAVSDGERAYPEEPSLASVRTIEQERALACLGVTADRIVRLGLPDADLANRVDAIARAIVDVIDADTLLVAPWRNDVHPDHEACGAAAEEVANAFGLERASSLFWAWHAVPIAAMPISSLVRIELDDAIVAARREAMDCHASQLVHDPGEPVLTPALLGPLTRTFEAYLR